MASPQEKTVRAHLHSLRMAPRKVRLVAGSVRGLSANEAEARLMLLPQRAAQPMLKLLRSAVASAKLAPHEMDPLKLYIKTLTVDGGSFRTTMMPRARGSASPIQKKTSHITLILAEAAKSKANRFKIVTVKKEKEIGDGKRSKRERSTNTKDDLGEKKNQAPGVFRRVFRRKSSTAD